MLLKKSGELIGLHYFFQNGSWILYCISNFLLRKFLEYWLQMSITKLNREVIINALDGELMRISDIMEAHTGF
jgi:hypothetical protein